MRMSLGELSTSGVWEATGVVAKFEFRGPLTFFGTSDFLSFSQSFRGFEISIVFVVCDAVRLLVFRAGVCGKAVGVTA